MPRIPRTSSDETILQELFRLRRELAKERARLDALEYLGLQTRPSNFGVWDCVLPRAAKRLWITRSGSRHTDLRAALDELLVLMKLATQTTKGNAHVE
jgi:hypothetical protein